MLRLAAALSCAVLGAPICWAKAPVRPWRHGYYDDKQIGGPASAQVRALLKSTYVPCTQISEAGPGVESGECNLDAITDLVQLVYFSAGADHDRSVAVAFVTYSDDTGSATETMLAFWRKDPQEGYRLGGTAETVNIQDVKPKAMVGHRVVVGGVTWGENDSGCCPTKSVSVSIQVQ